MIKLMKTMFLLTLIALMLFTFACKNNDQSDMLSITGSGKGDTAVPVKVEKIKRGSISSYIETTTTLEAEKDVDILSRTTGLVTKVLVEEGDYVKKGQLILTIDDSEAKATFSSTLAVYDERKSQWERAKETIQGGIISQEAYEQARYNFSKAEADLQSAKLRLSYTKVRAPFDGIITERNIHLGSMLSVNEKLFKVVDIKPLLARIHLPEKELAKVSIGQEATLKLEAYSGKEFKSIIKMINPVVDPTSGTFKVTLEINSDDNLLRPGLFASVYLVTETHENTLLAPKQSLVLEAEKDTIFIVDGKYAYSREIKIGFRDDRYIEILSGAEADQYIIVVGQDAINSGTEVKMFDREGTEIKVEEKEDTTDEEDLFE